MAVKGATGIVTGKDYRNIDVIAAVMPVPDSPWFMVSKMDVDEAFSIWRSRSLMMSGLIIGFLCLFATFILVIWLQNERDSYISLYQSELNLRASEERYGITLKSIGDAVIATDASGRLSC